MKNASLITPTAKMLAVGLALVCSYAYAGHEGYLSTSTAAGYSEVGPTAVYAGQDSVTARETARRRAEQQAALQLLQEGQTAYKDKKYSEALEKYRQAWDRLPQAPATRKAQEFIRECINDASIAVAMEYSKVGRWDAAEQLLLEVLRRDPRNRYALRQLSIVRDPERSNPALNPEHVKDVDEVNRLLELAYGAYQLGKYDQANIEFANVLRIDPYNIAARRGQEAVNNRRSHYYRVAHDTYRSKALAEVDSLWEETTPIVADFNSQEPVSTGSEGTPEKVLEIRRALDAIRIDRASFDNTPISDVVGYISTQIRRSGSARVNVNFVKPAQKAVASTVSAATSSDDEDDENEDEEDDDTPSTPVPVATVSADYVEPTVQVELEDVTLKQLLDEVCDQAGCVPIVRDTGIFIYTKDDPNAVTLDMRTWNNVPWDYLSGEGDGDDGDDDDGDPFGSSDGKATKGKYDPKPALSSGGVSWPKGSSATYNKRAQKLTVRNTPENLDLVDVLIDDARMNETPMVKVTTKFVEVSQMNDEELSFDWVVNPFSVSNSGNLYAGGVNGTASSPNRSYADFVTNGGPAYSNFHKNNGTWPVSNNSSYATSSDTLTNGLMTGGLRSGQGALSASTMDTLLNVGSPVSSSNTSPAPGILALSGIYDEGSFQMIMRGLSQKKGVDVMSAPSLVLTTGEEGTVENEVQPDDSYPTTHIDGEGAARIEVVRRFVYPIQYEPPSLNSTSNNNNNNNNNNSSSVPVATPAIPSEFGAEEVGLVMVVKADTPKSNNTIVRFSTFIVRVVDFEGFINYGSPIISGIANENEIETIVLTENRIDQPIFSRRMVNTVLSLYDGHTVAIGGMIEDKVQKVEDKVPVFGDLPLIGRFFRSNAESHTRKNLTIFVTADIIDATGRPLRSRINGSQQTGDTAVTPGLFPDDGLSH